ncbi:MAG: efflux RND transporter periplasmic adaptor subunit [Acetobacteraceae bacterium]|nr:efflux RND transporter periplasmic adaptor subunit [Acetobacteraceae bacterium]
MTLRPLALLAALLSFVTTSPAFAQMGAGGPPAVGVVRVAKQAITETAEYVGRIQAVDRVDLTARVSAFLNERLFKEGTEVKEGDLLYRLERGPFEAAAQQQSAVVAQTSALLQNATIALGRAQALLNTPAGQRSTYDDAKAQQMSEAAQLASAQAQLKTAQINLDYTEIHAPISGKISQTRVTPGNVVSPSSGPLATIVSQDPMYVVFPIAVRSALDLERKYADQGGLSAVAVQLKLPDGSLYPHEGKIDFVAPSVAQTTDTITLRGRIPNPPDRPPVPGQPVDRPLTDGMFVTVVISGVEPVAALAIPRTAVLADQQGNYVYVVNGQNIAEQHRIVLGQSTPTTAVVASGLQEGELVVVDGVQRVRPGQPVSPSPAAPATPSGPHAGVTGGPGMAGASSGR